MRKNYGEKKYVFFSRNGGHLGFSGNHQDTYNFKTAISNAVKITHRWVSSGQEDGERRRQIDVLVTDGDEDAPARTS